MMPLDALNHSLISVPFRSVVCFLGSIPREAAPARLSFYLMVVFPRYLFGLAATWAAKSGTRAGTLQWWEGELGNFSIWSKSFRFFGISTWINQFEKDPFCPFGTLILTNWQIVLLDWFLIFLFSDWRNSYFRESSQQLPSRPCGENLLPLCVRYTEAFSHQDPVWWSPKKDMLKYVKSFRRTVEDTSRNRSKQNKPLINNWFNFQHSKPLQGLVVEYAMTEIPNSFWLQMLAIWWVSLDALASKAVSSWFQTRFPSAPEWGSWIHLPSNSFKKVGQAHTSKVIQSFSTNQGAPFRGLRCCGPRRGVPRRESRRCATRCLHSDGGNERRDHDRRKSRAEMVGGCVLFFWFCSILFCKRSWKGEGDHTGLRQLDRHLHYTAIQSHCECFDIWF